MQLPMCVAGRGGGGGRGRAQRVAGQFSPGLPQRGLAHEGQSCQSSHLASPTHIQILTTVLRGDFCGDFSESEHRRFKGEDSKKEASTEKRGGNAHQPGLWHPMSVKETEDPDGSAGTDAHLREGDGHPRPWPAWIGPECTSEHRNDDK